MENLNIGICGWGNVATGLFKVLEENNTIIHQKTGCNINIKVIGARRDNPKCDPGDVIIERDIFDVLDHDIDAVVELIGGVDTARELILAAIKKGKHVVTANKAVLFHHGDEIFLEAKKANVSILFESAVCAGTPLIKVIQEELSANNITKIAGMLNGTTNFMLSEMEEGSSFEEVLKIAQDKGYAEPDPKFDIEGYDAAHKIGLLSSIAYGTPLPPDDFHIEGIINIKKIDFDYAKELGFSIKHLAVAKKDDSNIQLRSHPVLVKDDSYLANLKGVRNGIEIDTDLLGVIHIAGSGAGQEATASGLISDLINLMKTNGVFSFPDFPDSLNTIDIAELSFKYYFYIEAMDEPGVMASIASIFAENNISIETIIQKEPTDGVSPVILITNRYFEKNVNKVIKTLDSLASIKTYRTIRIED